MDPRRILLKVEALKRKSHRLSLDLRLKSLNDAKKFLREHAVVLWNGRSELPSLLDAMVGRIAKGRERNNGKAAENCFFWRAQLLEDPEFVECNFFQKQPTAPRQDLWPAITVFSRINRRQAENGLLVSRDARRILAFVDKEGPTSVDELRRVLKFSGPSGARLFSRAKKELFDKLIVSGDNIRHGKSHREVIDFWENRIPKSIRAKADQTSERDAKNYLLSATLSSSIMSNEKKMKGWFGWTNDSLHNALENLLHKKDFRRIRYRQNSWIIPSKVLSLKI